ncbi:MAG TPA: BON domain-containing protein [Pyrinomonadaceae bacterium]
MHSEPSRSLYSILISILFVVALFAGCSHKPTDVEIASEVQNKINADFNIPTKQISVGDTNGVVTLSGNVNSDMERIAAANDASQVEGVKTVVNNLQVAPAAASAPAQPSPMSSPVPRQRTRPSRPEVVRTRTTVVTIPEGTSLSVRLIDSIDSDKNKVGDKFRASLESPILAEGRVIVPKDADIDGEIASLNSAGHFTGRSEIALALTRLSFNGKTYEIETDQYKKEGASRGKRTAETVGGGAAVGALIGGLTGGGKGAAIGAGIGAGAGTGVQAVTKGQQIRLSSETLLEFRLNAPVTVEPSASSRNAGRARVE